MTTYEVYQPLCITDEIRTRVYFGTATANNPHRLGLAGLEAANFYVRGDPINLLDAGHVQKDRSIDLHDASHVHP